MICMKYLMWVSLLNLSGCDRYYIDNCKWMWTKDPKFELKDCFGIKFKSFISIMYSLDIAAIFRLVAFYVLKKLNSGRCLASDFSIYTE